MEPGDTELLESWRKGDLGSGEELFERYYPMVERFFINKVGTEVGDLVQDTFIACVENRFAVNDTGKFRSYLFAVAYNVLCAHLRRNYRAGRSIDFDTTSVYDLSPSPSSVMVRHREERLLLEALRQIPLDYQVLLELHYWDEMTTEEMAGVLGIPLGTVRRRLVRARELVEQALGRLERSPETLKSTVSRLDDWARQCRDQMK